MNFACAAHEGFSFQTHFALFFYQIAESSQTDVAEWESSTSRATTTTARTTKTTTTRTTTALPYWNVTCGTNDPYETWPWTVAVLVNVSGEFEHKSAGSIISSGAILTDALSVSTRSSRNKLVALTVDEVQVLLVNEDASQQIKLHPTKIVLYSSKRTSNNIALLHYELPDNMTVLPICLPTSDAASVSEEVGVEWMIEYEKALQSVLEVTDVDDNTCRKAYGNIRTARNFCAQSTSSQCNVNDHLYSLIDGEWYLRGITSRTLSSCNNPVLYEKIAQYYSWIVKNA